MNGKTAKRLPWGLIYLRLLLAPVAMLFGHYGILGAPYILLLAVAAASDYYDGVLARKLGVETAELRQWDSIADTFFFLGVLGGIWLAYPEIYKTYALGIYAILGTEMLRYMVDWSKFRRGASYHAWSAKAFGVALLAATIAIMGFGKAEPLFPLALALGILSEVEGLLMSLVLKKWTYNVKHLGVAMRLRRE